MSIGLSNILQAPQGVWSGRGMGVACVRGVGGAANGTIGSSSRMWRVGELEFEALMRMLDNKVVKQYFKSNINVTLIPRSSMQELKTYV